MGQLNTSLRCVNNTQLNTTKLPHNLVSRLSKPKVRHQSTTATKMTNHQTKVVWRVAAVLVLVVILASGNPLGRSATKATHVRPGANQSEFDWRLFLLCPTRTTRGRDTGTLTTIRKVREGSF